MDRTTSPARGEELPGLSLRKRHWGLSLLLAGLLLSTARAEPPEPTATSSGSSNGSPALSTVPTDRQGRIAYASWYALQPEADEQAPEQEPVEIQEPALEITVRPPTFIEEQVAIPRVGLVDESIFNSPQALTVVTEQELLERAPRTPAEALRYKPGIWIQKTGHRGGAPIIRGFMGNRVIYAFDGVRRNTASLFAGPNGFLQNIDALDVDRIEVIRGPGSVLYGSDAIGGVINVITNEEPIFTRRGSRIGARSYGRWATVDQELSGRQEFYLATPRVFAFVGGTLRDIDDLRAGAPRGVQVPSSWREENWDAQFDYLLQANHRIQFFFQEFNAPESKRYDRPTQDRATHRELYGLRYFARDWGLIEQLEATGYWHAQLQRTYRSGALDRDQADKTWGVDLKASTWLTQNTRAVYGFHIHEDDITQVNPRRGTRDPDVTWLNPALFFLAEMQVTDRIRIDAGVRWDQFTLKSFAPPLSEFPQEVQDAIALGELSIDDFNLDTTTDAVTGGIGFVVSVTENVNWVVHVGRAFRAPNKNDLLRFGQFTFGFNVPSPGVKPESSWTYETGIHGSYENLAYAVTFFHTELQDAIVSQPGTFGGRTFIDVDGDGIEDPDEGVFVKSNSPGVIVAKGIEFEGTYYLPWEWTYRWFGDYPVSIYGNFTWIDGQDKGNREPLDRMFPANGLFGIRVENSRDPDQRWWWVAGEAWMVRRFHRIRPARLAKDPAFRVDPQDRTSPLLRPDGSVPGFTIFNVRGGVYLTDSIVWTIGLENLFDKLYRVKDSRIDAPGMSFVTSLDMTY